MKQIIVKQLVRVLALILSLSFIADAQTWNQLDNLKNIVPPSPNASSLGKYTDWPVSLYTGIPNINIPIYELKGRSLSIPVNLSYHSSGIKVGEIASWVGLGWALDAGGIITRSVRGLPDDVPNIGYLAIRSAYTHPGDLASGTSPASLDSQNTVQAAQGLIDAEPDTYMFNAMGKSFKFFFLGDGTIVTQPFSNIRITTDQQADSWKIIFEDGTILNFGGTGFIERTDTRRFSPTNGGAGIDHFTSSWYLRSVTSTVGEVVHFTYQALNIHQSTFSSATDYMPNNSGTTPFASCGIDCQQTYLHEISAHEVQDVTSLFISTIETDLGRVDFFMDTTERLDLYGGRSLDSIKIFSKYSNTYLNQYRFNYHYSRAAGAGGSNDYSIYRLKLDSLNEIASDMNHIRSWNFEYNTELLPSRNSYAQDHFGYYNGALQNQTLLPEIITPLALHDHGFGPDHFVTGDRSANEYFMQAEMLTRITYPANGTTAFEYEANHYLNTEEAYQLGSRSHQVELYTGKSGPFITSIKDTIVIKKDQYIKILTNGFISLTFLNGHPSPNIHVTIKDLSGNSYGGAAISMNDDVSTTYNFLSPGTYVYETKVTGVEPNDFVNNGDYLRLNSFLSFKDGVGIQQVKKLVGGLRIKKQVINDGEGLFNSIQYMNYVYNDPFVIAPFDTVNAYLSTLKDQLKVRTSDNYGQSACYYDEGSTIEATCFQDYLVRNSSTKEGLGTIQGGGIGYGEVRINYGANAENGYMVNKYTNTDGDENTELAKTFPYPAVCTQDWRRGLLLEQATYTNEGRLLKKETEEYEIITKNSVFGFKAGIQNQRHSILATTRNDVSRIDLKLKTEIVRKKLSKDVVYDQAGSSNISKLTNFYYDNPLSLLATRTEYQDSKGQLVQTYSRTALDKTDINTSISLTSDATAAIDTLVSRNMITTVLEQEQFKANILLAKNIVDYTNRSASLVLPSLVKAQVGNNPIEDRVNFNSYDNYGNLVEQQKSNDLLSSFIYDYAATYPVAQCTNAPGSGIAYTSFEADATGNWQGINAGNIHFTTAVTGNKYYTFSGTTLSKNDLINGKNYIVSYWSNAGTCTVAGTVGAIKTGRTFGSWTYYEHEITGISQATISGGGSIDELRLYPKNAQMTTYTYEPLVGMTSQCDMNNRITYYVYDSFGRLQVVKDQDGNIIKTLQYNYFKK